MALLITTAMPTSFKVELLKGVHNFSNPGGDVFKIVQIHAFQLELLLGVRFPACRGRIYPELSG